MFKRKTFLLKSYRYFIVHVVDTISVVSQLHLLSSSSARQTVCHLHSPDNRIGSLGLPDRCVFIPGEAHGRGGGVDWGGGGSYHIITVRTGVSSPRQLRTELAGGNNGAAWKGLKYFCWLKYFYLGNHWGWYGDRLTEGWELARVAAGNIQPATQ